MNNLTLVGGTFNANGGTKSNLVDHLHLELLVQGFQVHVQNGGTQEDLHLSPDSEIVIWMADRASTEKLLELKKRQPHIIVITTSSNQDDDYRVEDFIGKLIAQKANLGILMVNEEYSLIDPLGNIYCKSKKVSTLADRITRRVKVLQKLQRRSSQSLGSQSGTSVPEDFMKVVRYCEEQFAKFIKKVNPNRLLGETPTRCSFGFPAVKTENGYYVSPREATTSLDSSDFIKVSNSERKVEYYGNKKPTLDAPLQIKIFNAFPKVKYIIHGHTYAESKTITSYKFPCGAIEDIFELRKLLPPDTGNACLNLRGHGCLILAEDLNFFKTLKFSDRPVPEN